MTSSSIATRFGRVIDAALIVAGVAAIAALSWSNMAILGDGFWSIASGQAIVTARAMPAVDAWSFASDAKRWVIFNPGAAVLFGAVAKRLGLRAVLVLGAALETVAAAGLWIASAKTTTARALLLPLALLFVWVDAEDLSARAQLFGDLAFVALVAMLGRLLDGKRVSPLAAIALGCFWANGHLSFLAAPALPIAALLFALADPPDARPPLVPIAVFALCAAIGTLATPYGPRYVALALRVALDPSTRTLDLHHSPPFHDARWWIGPAIGLALVALRERAGTTRARRAEQLLVLLFVAASAISRRYCAQLFAIEALVLGRVLAAWPMARTRKVDVALGAAAAVMTALAAIGLASPKDPLRDAPAGAAAFITEHALPGRIVNPLHWGGYLAYAWRGSPQYFIDGRDHLFLFGNGVYDDSVRLWSGAEGSEALLDVYEAGTVLWERGSPLDARLAASDAWRLAYADRIAVVYVRARATRATP